MAEKWKIAEAMVSWVRELHVRENAMRTDADVEAVVEGISEGNVLSLAEALGIGRAGARPSRGGMRISGRVIHEFAERLAGKLYPDGAWTIEDVCWRSTAAQVHVWLQLHLAYPE